MSPKPDIPLCVDLDGTLVKTDMLFECALRLLSQSPLYFFHMLVWLTRGKATLKREVVSRVTLEPNLFPFNEEILDYTRQQQALRKTVLVTGSDQTIADYVAHNSKVFDLAKGSDGETNLTAHHKRDWLVSEYGAGGYDYIGNEEDDVVVWSDARHALFAGDTDSASHFADPAFEKIFAVPKPKLCDYLNLIRLHQWSKNTLIFIPFLLDKTVQTWPNFAMALMCFVAMSLLASTTYIINDLLDLAADRLNATKKERALASCRVSISRGLWVSFALFCAFLIVMLFLPIEINLILLFYLACTLYYSFFLKRRMILDVCTIAGLHTLRIIAGMLAVGASWSFWLLAFSMFVFFSLAMAKRVSELTNLRDAGLEPASGRGYRIMDLPMLNTIGVSSGFISVLVVALFINSEKVASTYSQPILLWLLCPLLMYWIGRVWIITARGELHEDPIVFAVRDRVSIAVVTALAVVVASASFL